MNEKLSMFLNCIVDIKGNISSRRLTESFFCKINKQNLWDWFIAEKEKFPGYSNIDVINFLKFGLYEPPKCIVCGGKSVKGETSSYLYCSRNCSFKSPIRAENIKNSHNNVDKISANKKRELTMEHKYGVKFNSQRPEIKNVISEKLSKSQIPSDSRNLLLNRDWLNEQYVLNKRTSIDIADELNVYYGTVLEYCRKYGFAIRKNCGESLPQKQIFDYIKTIYQGEIRYNDWSVLNNLELDIYLPELNLAIEHNGLYTHSSNCFNEKNKTRHFQKTNRCEELGIKLLHIREDQWYNKQEIVKSIINNKLNLNTKIFARKCQIVTLDSNTARNFCVDNHIQGYFDSKFKFGLVYNKKLVSVMTFNRCRNGSNGDWELVRFCNLLNHSVIGGFGKLLSNFRKCYGGSIISYCDRQRSYGDIYLKFGFVQLNTIVPGFCWTDKKHVFSREKFQKYKLEKLLKSFDSNLSAFENMFNNGYRVIYDSGQISFFLQ